MRVKVATKGIAADDKAGIIKDGKLSRVSPEGDMVGNKENKGISDVGSKPDFSSYSPTQLRELYQVDAGLFTELADDAIRMACIGKTPERTLKLKQLQWTIDSRLRKGKTPLERMQIMENIFYGEVYGSNGLLVKLVRTFEKLRRYCS